jgi:predicted small integral membrane protein
VVNDAPAPSYPKTCWLEAIFARQTELREKYHKIEEANGFKQPESIPMNLDDRFAQAMIKDMAWRFTEELGEAHECLEPYRDGTNIWQKCPQIMHYHEELIDALHFLTELSLLAGVTHLDIANPGIEPSGRIDDLLLHRGDLKKVIVDDLHQTAFEAIMYLGLACNELKNKPWKQTHQLTDTIRFRRLIERVWDRFGELLLMAGFDSALVFDLYTRKNEVNAARIKSNY